MYACGKCIGTQLHEKNGRKNERKKRKEKKKE